MIAELSADELRVRTRRALGLVAMSAVVPGSAQFVAGNRRLGRVALRTWATLWLLALVALLGLWLFRGPTLAVLLNGPLTSMLRVGVWVVFAGWALLLFDAWRLARPGGLVRRSRLVLTASCLVLVVLAGFGANLVSSAFTAANNVSSVFKGGGDNEEKAGRYNILLLGVDAASDREGIRPDSINVASVDASTGRTVVFGLPRNLQGAPFPKSSPLHALYPDGYDCPDSECMLNAVYTLGDDNSELYPGMEAGLEATREAVGETLGLDINYYAMVDMAGFESLIDAMGGITLDIGRDVPIGGGGSPVSGYVEAGENVHLDGYHALWFARSRHGSSDYERMTRQKCVMAAMTKQLDPAVVATKFVELSEAGKDLVVTDVGAGHVAELAELALRAKSLDLETVDFTPPLIITADPDFAFIRSTVTESIAATEALDDSAAATPPPAADPPTEATTPEPEPTPAVTDDDGQESAIPEPDPSSFEPDPASEEQPICTVS